MSKTNTDRQRAFDAISKWLDMCPGISMADMIDRMTYMRRKAKTNAARVCICLMQDAFDFMVYQSEQPGHLDLD